ncbi:hypothetical protein ILUMI_02386 [Ignelater luminosus]|uniref:Protein aurora borealis n=1 Tax=Ignelater luminosus TaxID=2038154 RepID=A0A8K0GGH4_IGNLU|nr:hypothetical protein ILUMI_02386 [Ignelater luminosus]
METKTNCDKNTPAKRTIQNILLEKAVQGKFTYPFVCDSPFRLLPLASTPPSRVGKIRNPFETQLTERLHQSVFSPSVFNMQSTKTEEKFKWTIEDISSLKPADIDETTVEQFELSHDPELEQTAQANIEKFFSEKHIVPSPFDAAVKRVALISESTSPMKSEKQTTNSVAQTVLTLPPILPKDVEDALKPYFSYTVDQQQDSNRNNSLYRRLFEYDEEQHSSSSVLTSPAPSCNLSPIEFSPLDENKMQTHRNFGSPQDVNHMAECNLSPIAMNLTETHVASSISVMRSNFSGHSGHMSIDTSLNLVPDMLNQMPSNNQSLAFESTHSPTPEVLSNSLVNWDMEYRHVSLESPKSQNSENEMDVSNSNTPKSKIFTSQRKKLSDSFLNIEHMDENKENAYDINNYVERRSTKSNVFVRNDTTDGGYHTGNGLTMIEESWNSSHLYASTPTKSKNC